MKRIIKAILPRLFREEPGRLLGYSSRKLRSLENKFKGIHKCYKPKRNEIPKLEYRFKFSQTYKELEMPIIVEFCFPEPFEPYEQNLTKISEFR